MKPTSVPRNLAGYLHGLADLFCTPSLNNLPAPVQLRTDRALQLYSTYGDTILTVLMKYEWDPRDECQNAPAPVIVVKKNSNDPDPFCVHQYRYITDVCDNADGQDKHGGRLYVNCAIYEWMAFPGNVGDAHENTVEWVKTVIA